MHYICSVALNSQLSDAFQSKYSLKHVWHESNHPHHCMQTFFVTTLLFIQIKLIYKNKGSSSFMGNTPNIYTVLSNFLWVTAAVSELQ